LYIGSEQQLVTTTMRRITCDLSGSLGGSCLSRRVEPVVSPFAVSISYIFCCLLDQ